MKKKIIGKIISIGQMICPMVFSHARLFVWVVRKFSFITGVRGVPRSNDRSLLCDLIRQQSLKCASSLETCVLSHHLLVSGTINIGTSVSCLIFQLCWFCTKYDVLKIHILLGRFGKKKLGWPLFNYSSAR